MKIHLELDLKSTKLLGQFLGRKINNYDTILLFGNLGSGKTTIAKHIICGYLGLKIEISSPTFQLIKQYSNESKEIYHADLYRLKDDVGSISSEIDHILRNCTSIIEWPEIIADLANDSALSIEIAIINNKKRKFILSSNSKHWTNEIKNISINLVGK